MLNPLTMSGGESWPHGHHPAVVLTGPIAETRQGVSCRIYRSVTRPLYASLGPFRGQIMRTEHKVQSPWITVQHYPIISMEDGPEIFNRYAQNMTGMSW